ncbi:permease [Leucobacter muris]|uniref:Permease n=1 Tax=Leucobacter muris TaxID=1935379 RepID=A0ABX5QE64_9MICO|nr:permease [Leucobacter muris]QAB17361.1 permease [Leucobacter muris]
MRGVAAAGAAAVLFAAIFYLSGAVDVGADVMFGTRILITCACYALALAHPAARRLLRDYWTALRSLRWGMLLLPVLCALVGAQLWLFSWAPLHGHALDASLGFLLLPLGIVLGSKLLLRAEVTRIQWAAVGAAAVAVGLKLALTPEVSWVTAAICLGYPAYFVLRRRYGLDNPAAFGVEVAVIAPVAILLMRFGGPFPDGATERFALIGVGIAGATAMFAYLAAAQRLPLPVFGVLGYLEPVLLVVVALLLGERLHGSDLLTYGLLAVALGLLAVEGFRNARSPVGVRDDPAVRPGTRPRPLRRRR